MNLPPKALHALLDIKKELLSKSVMITSGPTSNISTSSIPSTPSTASPLNRPDVMITRKSTQVMRHARNRGWAVQRMYQRGEL